MILQVWSVWSDYEIMTTICMLTLLIYQHVKKFTLPLISPQKAHTITLSKSLRIGFLNCTIQPPFFHIIAMHCSKPFFRLLPWFIFFFFLSGDDAIVQSDAKGKHDTFLTLSFGWIIWSVAVVEYYSSYFAPTPIRSTSEFRVTRCISY